MSSPEKDKKITRRRFVERAAAGTAAAVGAGFLAGCNQTPQIVKETVQVPVEVVKEVTVVAPASAAGPVTFEVLSPRGEIEPPKMSGLAAPRLTTLDGKTIGIYWNGKADTPIYYDRLQQLLLEKHPTAKVQRYQGAYDAGDTIAKQMAEECDAFIYGVGD